MPTKTSPAFVADCHLGKLAKYLRMMGFDTLYFASIDDDDLIRLAREEDRIILSRDRELCTRKKAPCLLLEPVDTVAQLKTVIGAYGLKTLHVPFSRCLVCNTPLQFIDKKEVSGRVPPKIEKFFSDFEICPKCERIYWHGDHYKRMKQLIDTVLEEV
jgi:uncharacterized protein with PIN domain